MKALHLDSSDKLIGSYRVDRSHALQVRFFSDVTTIWNAGKC